MLWCMDILWLTFAINGVTISHTQYITMLSFEKVIYYVVHYIKYDKFLNDVFLLPTDYITGVNIIIFFDEVR